MQGIRHGVLLQTYPHARRLGLEAQAEVRVRHLEAYLGRHVPSAEAMLHVHRKEDRNSRIAICHTVHRLAELLVPYGCTRHERAGGEHDNMYFEPCVCCSGFRTATLNGAHLVDMGGGRVQVQTERPDVIETHRALHVPAPGLEPRSVVDTHRMSRH